MQKIHGVPMFVSGELRGFIGIHHSEEGSYRAEEIELAQALAHHVMMAAHGQELVEQQREAAVSKSEPAWRETFTIPSRRDSPA